MPISFFDVSDSDGWTSLNPQDDPNGYWADGGFVSAAPVDGVATFAGNYFASTNVDERFGMRGRRISAGFTMPKRHVSLRQLQVVTSGGMTVKTDSGDEVKLGLGDFWINEANEPYTVTAGPEGVTYIESYPQSLTIVETTWYDDPNWVRK